MSTRTVTYNTGAQSTGFPSKAVALLAALFVILWSVLDVNFHGHFHCDTQRAMVMKLVNSRLHLAAFTKPNQTDFAGQPESGQVKCECTGDRKIRLTGKVVNENIRQEFSDLATYAVGNNGVDN